MQPTAPKYLQIKNRLCRQMAEGRARHRLPSENELARRFQVSRMTARKALNELLRDGLVERIPGKGTFVKQPRLIQAYFHIHAFAENAKRLGAKANTRVDRLKIGPLPADLADTLPGRRAVCIQRVHFLDDRPVCYEDRYLREDWCGALVNEDLANQSIHHLMTDKLALSITRVWQRLEAVHLPAPIAAALDTENTAPAFCMRQLIYTADDPVSYVDYYLRSDVYAFEDIFEPGRRTSAGWLGNGGPALMRSR